MKKFLFLAMMLCGSLWGFAQKTDVLMATLQHGDQVKVYYGQGAFKAAYEAAADSGDVITLSAGTFSGFYTVQKSLTIKGAGVVKNPELGIYPTIICNGNFELKPRDYVNDDGETIQEGISINGSRIEGIIFTHQVRIEGKRKAENIQLVKCQVGDYFSIQPVAENITIRQCLLHKVSVGYSNSCSNVLFANSIIDENFEMLRGGTIYFKNCLIPKCPNFSLTYENCILSTAPKVGSTVNNCILINCAEAEYVGTGNWSNKKIQGIFVEDLPGLWWNPSRTYELKYPDTYKGTDGTQVGLHGGPYPFNLTPTTPQISNCQIDDATAADGTIKVSITVQAQTED